MADNGISQVNDIAINPGGRYLSRCFNPSMEPLIGKYLEYKNRVELLCQDYGGKPLPPPLAFCQQKMVEIESALFPGKWWKRGKVIVAWQLLHRVSEELILVMEREELIAFGLRMVHEVATSGLPDVQKKEWSDRVAGQIRNLEEKGPAQGAPGQQIGDSSASLLTARYLFKNVYRAVNSIVDDNFWELWAKKFIALGYTLLLIVITGLFCLTDWNSGITPKMIFLLGAIGGLLSGIITGEQAPLPKGHFWGQIFYYLLVRPTIGALTALVVFWALESQFLVKVTPPLPAVSTVKNMAAANPIPVVRAEGVEGVSVPPEPGIATPPASEGPGGEEKTGAPTVIFQSAEGKQGSLIMLILLFAGFSGDKLLKSIADRVTMKMIAQAEKTKEAV